MKNYDPLNGVDAKSPYIVYVSDKPLTLPIKDPKRVALAYNVLRELGNAGAEIEFEPFDEDELHVLDVNGQSYIPPLEPEWHEEEADKKYFDAAKKLAEQNGTEAGIYAIYQKGMDLDVDDFIPVTCDKEKAIEITNFLKHGLDPDVELHVEYTDMETRDWYMAPINNEDLCVEFNYEDDITEGIPDEPNWANGEMSPNIIQLDDISEQDDEQDFADAVASISEDSLKLE